MDSGWDVRGHNPHGSATKALITSVKTLSQNGIHVGSYIGVHPMYILMESRDVWAVYYGSYIKFIGQCRSNF